jgi:branched-chain amino acid transport system permease protein
LIGSALAGAAGFVSGVYYGTTWFFNGFEAGLKAFTAAVLGGIGNVAGAMLGGFLIGLVEAFATQYIPSGAQWTNVVVFSVLVLVLVFRPSGLLGEALPEKV